MGQKIAVVPKNALTKHTSCQICHAVDCTAWKVGFSSPWTPANLPNVRQFTTIYSLWMLHSSVPHIDGNEPWRMWRAPAVVWMALISIWIAATPRLAKECLAWLEFPHSVLDDTTTLLIGWQVWNGLGYSSPWVIIIIIIIIIYLGLYIFIYFIYAMLYFHVLVILRKMSCQERAVYSKIELY